MKLKIPFRYVANYPHKADCMNQKAPKCELGGAKAVYPNATNYTCTAVSFFSACRKVQLINHSFKKDSAKFEIESQIILQVV